LAVTSGAQTRYLRAFSHELYSLVSIGPDDLVLVLRYWSPTLEDVPVAEAGGAWWGDVEILTPRGERGWILADFLTPLATRCNAG
jgi:hypothetical protein